MYESKQSLESLEFRRYFASTSLDLGTLSGPAVNDTSTASVTAGTDGLGNPFFAANDRLYLFQLTGTNDLAVSIQGTVADDSDGATVSVYRELGNLGVLDAAEQSGTLAMQFQATLAGAPNFSGSLNTAASADPALVSGNYLVIVRTRHVETAGVTTGTTNFTITLDPAAVAPPNDPDDTIAEAGVNTLAVGGSINLGIADAGDVDVIKFTATAGQHLAFDLDRTSGNLNSYLRLFSAGGSQLKANDNGAAPGEGASNDSYLDYTFSTAGTYYLGVSAAGNTAYNVLNGSGDSGGSTSGNFTLRITEISDAPPPPPPPGDDFAVITNGVLVVTGTSGDDAMGVSAKKGNYYATLNGQTLTFSASLVTDVAMLGGDGNDRMGVGAGVPTAYVEGGAGKDRIGGGAGDDRLYSGTGNDIVDGGPGNDLIVTAGGHDYVLGGEGDDKIYAGGGNDTVDAGAGRDRVYGGDGDDALSGSSGRDVLYGEIGADVLSGGKHNDYGDNDPADTRISIELLV